MLVAFLESIKYTGHLFPISLLRVYIGYYYLGKGLDFYSSNFVNYPIIAESAKGAVVSGTLPYWYVDFLTKVFIPHWNVFAYAILIICFLTAISYLLGYLVRPVSVMVALMNLHLVAVSASVFEITQLKTFVVIHLTLAWLGAGRCLGLDYFFYKRHRGIWW